MSQFYDLNIQGSEVQLRLDLASHNVLAFDGLLDVSVVASDELITSADSYQIVYAPNGGRGEMLMAVNGAYYRNFRLEVNGKAVLDSSWYNTDGQIRRDRLFLNGAARDIYAYAAGAFGKVERDGVDGITPHIDPVTRHWMIGEADTGILARGTDGESAYQTAVKEGYKGTQSEWIASLHGLGGKSAYEIWVEQPGNDGKSVSEFLASLKESGFGSKAVLLRPTKDIDTNTIYCIPNPNNTNEWTEEIYDTLSGWIVLATHLGGLTDIIARLQTIVDDNENDFSVKDDDGNAIFACLGGHIKTKNFDSRNAATKEELSKLEEEIRDDIPDIGTLPQVVDNPDADYSVKDENGIPIFEAKGGHFRTKNFNSKRIVNSEYDGKILSPYAIYTTCNDVPNGANDGNLNRNMSQAVYLDHFLNGLTEEKNIRFKEAVDKVVFTSPMEVTSSVETNRPTKFNDGVDILETNKAITINGYDIDEQTHNVRYRSTLNSVTQPAHPKILILGDSITHGEMATIPNDNYTQNYVYHLIAKQLFMKDKIDNNGNGFDITFLGRNKRTNTFEYNGTSYVCETHHEGYRGYSLLNFLESTNSYVQAFHSSTTNRFSLKAYIDRFRTMDDDGNRLPWSSAGATVTGTDGKSYTIGTEINTEAKLNSIYVCTPTHIVIALGANGNATIAEYEEIIGIIKGEYPSIQIGIALSDSSGTFFPSLHPHTDDKCIVWNDTSSRHDKLFNLMDRLQNRFGNTEDEANGIYIIPFFFVSPTAEGVSTRYAPLPDAEMNLTENNRYYSSFGWVSSIHTNGYGHMNWGYSLYSWLKYSIAKSLE